MSIFYFTRRLADSKSSNSMTHPRHKSRSTYNFILKQPFQYLKWRFNKIAVLLKHKLHFAIVGSRSMYKINHLFRKLSF
nr:hypothetical protein Iba_chr12bCG3920 [Ipomoea batatas]